MCSSDLINFKPVRRCFALPYYLYCLRLCRLVLIFVNSLWFSDEVGIYFLLEGAEAVPPIISLAHSTALCLILVFSSPPTSPPISFDISSMDIWSAVFSEAHEQICCTVSDGIALLFGAFSTQMAVALLMKWPRSSSPKVSCTVSWTERSHEHRRSAQRGAKSNEAGCLIVII